ncbi:rab9 effector protein with kelch motifs [Selaginella moellendorffii]|uniref:rab9 effector protein with kelch motifs n=1 Tax=Selaginella moellendorffii TaxID=88036 RepID=UPI000D1C9970|nr:rab9 effector protein with kelch motifs [Selaginella moellendorffii]|eukprot:XP_024523561.1 rab9 effector protein with kelch motifs [Selaginella moellendorffii]
MVLIMFWWDRAGTYTWSKPVMKRTHPSPRDSHSSTAVGSKLYVFGGTDGTSPLDDLFVLDTGKRVLSIFFFLFLSSDAATNTWGKPDVFGDVPAPREGHSASLIGDNLFVFGGCGKSSDPSEEEYYNDLHETMAWQEVKTTGAELMPRAGERRARHIILLWGM